MDIGTFLDKLGSGTPVPGGGSASAIVGSISSALSKMVANLTLGRKKYADQKEFMEKAVEELSKIQEKFLSLSREDEEAFNEISATWKLPKNTEEERRVRADKMKSATLKALEPPWKMASTAISVLELAGELVERGNKNAVSDAACSAEFAMATFRSASYNILINLRSLDEPDVVENEIAKLNIMEGEAQRLYLKAVGPFKEKFKDALMKK